MKKEVTVQAKTVEEAVAEGAVQLGTDKSGVIYEVIEEAKKGFLGMGSAPAKVKVTYVMKPLEAARNFVETLIADLELDAQVVIHDDGNGEALMEIVGPDASALIGHHGDTLDAFQYLVNLAANKKETDERKYTRISVDIENYREKREQALRALADRMAAKVKKNGRSITLEPMNAYERRIIHAQVQTIDGVSTSSVGPEGNRRVVIYTEGSEKPTEESVAKSEHDSSRRDRRNQKNSRQKKAPRQKTEEQSSRETTYKRPANAPRPQPRKIEKAKDLDAYFAKLKEFSSNNPN
ncbi:MAG: protein jag [Clostridia bacterium]|nr:protein jag [Clostridia bacterium]